jgi:hypothetical protein
MFGMSNGPFGSLAAARELITGAPLRFGGTPF